MRKILKFVTGGVIVSFALALGVSTAFAQAELAVTKDSKVDSVEGCKFVLFSVEVQNTGDETAENVFAVDTLDSRYVFSEETTIGVSHAERSLLADGSTQLRWNIGDLAPGEDTLLAYSAVSPILSSDTTINNSVTVDSDDTAEITVSEGVLVEATPVSVICFETEGGIGGPLLVQDGTGGPLPSTGINPILYLGLVLPLALGIERWAWARERRK